jgi:nucleosome binding factor SPN SPT16 subunit
LTEGAKSTKDTLFFLNPENEIDVEEDKPKVSKKAPVKPLVNGSPIKNKTVAGKVLRNKTRSAAQEEVLMTAAAKIKEHQQQLHEGLQTAGLAKYSEGGSGGGEKEGKTWKRFQSYKGESALPREVESLRVSGLIHYLEFYRLRRHCLDLRRPQDSNNFTARARIRCAFPHQHHQKREQE